MTPEQQAAYESFQKRISSALEKEEFGPNLTEGIQKYEFTKESFEEGLQNARCQHEFS